MPTEAEELVRQFQDAGFRVDYRSTAVTRLVHHAHPGVEVRIGTVYLVVARDERELYRAPLRSANLATALSRLRA